MASELPECDGDERPLPEEEGIQGLESGSGVLNISLSTLQP